MKPIANKGLRHPGFWAGLLAALLAAPGNAVEIPRLPLQTGTAYPPANVMFILDDSGSMTYDYMPDTLPSVSAGNGSGKVEINAQTYTANAIYYNPNIDYHGWRNADGTRMADTPFTAVYSDDDLASGTTRDLDRCSLDRSAWSCSNNKWASWDFYVPATAAGLDDASNYTQYRFTNGKLYAASWSKSRKTWDTPQAVASVTWPGGIERTVAQERQNFANWYSYHRTRIKIAKAGASEAFGQIGSGVRVGYDSIWNRNPLPIPVNTPSASNDTTAAWNISSLDGRTWWSQGSGDHTIEVPAGASRLVVGISGSSRGDADLYVKRGGQPKSNPDRTSTGSGNSESISIDNPQAGTWYIDVYNNASGNGNNSKVQGENVVARVSAPAAGSNYGLFEGDNKSNWYAKLFAAQGNDGTPLRSALKRTGDYYRNFDASGPWGPETGANQYSCRQAFAILTTDGYWNGDSGLNVGNQDGTAGVEIKRADGTGSYRYAAKTPYTDDRSNTLADVAMKYWKEDLSPGDSGLANNVPTSTADPAFWQHMVTFGVSIGAKGTIDPKTALQSIVNGTAWPDPKMGDTSSSSSVPTRIDDLWHASVNGHGNFVAASDPGEFVQGLVDALATVAQRLGSASNVTANSTSFQTETRVYQASYVSGKWTGELAAYEVSSAGVSSKDLDGDGLADAAWRASTMIPEPKQRKVFTWSGSAGTTFPTSAQLTALAVPTRAPVDGGPATGQEIADYVVGSAAKELRNGGSMRDRDSKLGDIANSSPMYVEDSKSIFVGANDGMLHAFAAVDRTKGSKAKGGQELFAYIPKGVGASALASLGNPRYNHGYFVDGPVVVSARAQTTDSKNYLVGTLGRGGTGLFALDVTDPDGFKASNVLWDYTGSDFSGDMGMVLGEPLIVQLNDGTDAVVVGNGIDSTNRHAVLFVIDLETGAVIRKFDTGAGGDNGLSAPRGVDVNGDRKVDFVYAGDLAGDIWKFDLSASTSAAWSIANGGSPAFTAVDAGGNAQPVTAGLAVARDPKTGKIWIFAGTGKFMENGDIADASVQTIYGFTDTGSATSRASLVERTIVVAGQAPDGREIRGFEATTPVPDDKRGWYIDLDFPKPQGERVVSNPRVQGSVLLVPSMIPPRTGTCEAGGTGFINALDAFTGTSLGAPYFDVNNDGKFDDNDKLQADGSLVPVGSIDLGVGMPTLPTLIDKLLVVGGSRGTLGSIVMNPQGGSARRISWREILRD